jgi:Cu/Ag efflux protein CusF
MTTSHLTVKQLLIAAACTLPWAAMAQATSDHSHSHHPAPASAPASVAPAAFAPAALASPATAPAPELAEGEVRRIDQETGKVTLRHGPIKNLDMPPMTMVFTASDPALLAPLKVGDKVRFQAVQEAGKYMVTDIQPRP